MLSNLQLLNEEIVNCRKCPRLTTYLDFISSKKKRMYVNQNYWGKPVTGFGDHKARLLIIGLAPAAHGANRTGRMFTGDSSGEWLFRTLHNFGLSNKPTSTDVGDGLFTANVYTTAALRCAPPKNKPLLEELHNCRPFLFKEFTYLEDLEVVLTLGRVAFNSYLSLWKGSNSYKHIARFKFSHNGVFVMPDETHVVTSYHPSRQNTQTGRLTQAMFNDVFTTITEILDSREHYKGP